MQELLIKVKVNNCLAYMALHPSLGSVDDVIDNINNDTTLTNEQRLQILLRILELLGNRSACS